MAMSGPLGRILASEWSLLRPDVTFIDMGSFWDKELFGKMHHAIANSIPCMYKSDVKSG